MWLGSGITEWMLSGYSWGLWRGLWLPPALINHIQIRDWSWPCVSGQVHLKPSRFSSQLFSHTSFCCFFSCSYAVFRRWIACLYSCLIVQYCSCFINCPQTGKIDWCLVMIRLQFLHENSTHLLRDKGWLYSLN